MAINPLHIRSGNLILDDSDERMLVGNIDIEDVLYPDYNGVPITEALLRQLGLRQINDSGWWAVSDTNINLKFYPNTPSDLDTAVGFLRPGFHSSDTQISGVKIEYAHTLQNYVQAASGRELSTDLAMA